MLFHLSPCLKQVVRRQNQGRRGGHNDSGDAKEWFMSQELELLYFKEAISPMHAILHSHVSQCTNYHSLCKNDPKAHQSKQKFSVSVSMLVQESRGDLAVSIGLVPEATIGVSFRGASCLKRQMGRGYTTKSTDGC